MTNEHDIFRANGGIAIAQGPSGARWNFGWHNNPAEVAKVLATLPFPRYEMAAPNLTGTGEGKSAFLWEAVQKVYGRHLPAQQQPRGTCVSRGWSRAVDYLECVEIALLGEPEEFKPVSHAAVYAMAKEVGHDLGRQNLNENGDGAVGAWAAKVATDYGFATNEDAGTDDLAIQWAVSGAPQKIKDLAKEHKARVVTLVTTPEQARDMLCNGYPVSVCSDQGFMMTRDVEGHCRAQGTWNHCMFWSGWDDEKKRFCVEQSWGQNTPSGPLYKGQPDNSFWIDWDVAARMLRQEDSFAVAGFNGFVARELNWLI